MQYTVLDHDLLAFAVGMAKWFTDHPKCKITFQVGRISQMQNVSKIKEELK